MDYHKLASNSHTKGEPSEAHLTDENLAEGATEREAQDVTEDLGVGPHEVHCLGQFGIVGVEEEVSNRQERAGCIECTHHLRTLEVLVLDEDVVLHGVGEAVKEEVHAQKHQAPGGGGLGALAFLAGGGVVEGEDGDAGGDGGDDGVLVEGVGAAEDGEVEGHHGHEFAGFGEDEGDVVDVLEGGVAEGGGQGLTYCYEEELAEDVEIGEDGGGGGAGFGGAAEVDVADEGGEEGLDGIEDEGVAEDSFVGAVGGCCYAFL